MSSKTELPTLAAAATSSAPPWIRLPSNLTANILRRLGAVELLQSAQFVCATWWNHCKDPGMWRVIKLDGAGIVDKKVYTAMCRHAVDRSQGQLIDLTINDLVDGELLLYVADRSSELRRLTLVRCCFKIRGTVITEAVKKLTNLEELQLIQISNGVDIEAIAISCPLLKSFAFDQLKHISPYDCSKPNAQATAISLNMPNLCSLRLFNNSLDNEGLQAILDGCPRLESLDLRRSFGIFIRGPLIDRCREQIKDVKLSADSVDDYGYEFLTGGDFSDYDDDLADFYYEHVGYDND